MIAEQFRYKRWADMRTLAAISCVDSHKYSGTLTFARQQLNHIVIVEELFKARLLQAPAPHSRTNSELVPEISELENRLGQSHQWYLNFVSDLDGMDTDNKISFVFADGQSGALSVTEILFHIVNHSSYHRGSIAHALDLAQVAHPIDGYGIYIHQQEPARRDLT